MPSIQFKGKSMVHSHHLTVPYHQLLPDEKKSVLAKGERASLHGNVIIKGDNLHALKALLPAYASRVKCIYIDPPYNTGNEGWAYNDNVNHPMLQEWLGKTVDKEDLTRHDKWLCMMTPRLKLLRELLRDDGVIFISIDDNEVHRLRMVMDEIFGEENFVGQVIWQKVYSPRMDAQAFSQDHDYLLVYRRTETATIDRIKFEQNIKQFVSRDKDGRLYRQRSLRKEGKNSSREDRPSLYFSLTAPDGTQVFPIRGDGSEGRWRWAKEKYDEAVKQDWVEWIKVGGTWQIYVKQHYDVNAARPPSTLWLHQEVGHNHEAAEEIKGLFGDMLFDSPKPVRLLKRVFEVCTQPGDIILDSFAGSGTTAHATLALNAEDGGNRRFVLIEQEDYADTITAERVRRVIKGVKGAKDDKLKKGLGGSFSYFDLGPSMDEETLLRGGLPDYMTMARYVFFTATGEKMDDKQVKAKTHYLGQSSHFHVYLIYKPDVAYLKATPLNLRYAMDLPPWKMGEKKRLIIAPAKYLDEDRMDEYGIEFCQLPWGIYKYRAS